MALINNDIFLEILKFVDDNNFKKMNLLNRFTFYSIKKYFPKKNLIWFFKTLYLNETWGNTEAELKEKKLLENQRCRTQNIEIVLNSPTNLEAFIFINKYKHLFNESYLRLDIFNNLSASFLRSKFCRLGFFLLLWYNL